MDWMCGIIIENGSNLNSNSMTNYTLETSESNESTADSWDSVSNLTSEQENAVRVQQDFMNFCNMIIMPSLSSFGVLGNCINLAILTKKVSQ